MRVVAKSLRESTLMQLLQDKRANLRKLQVVLLSTTYSSAQGHPQSMSQPYIHMQQKLSWQANKPVVRVRVSHHLSITVSHTPTLSLQASVVSHITPSSFHRANASVYGPLIALYLNISGLTSAIFNLSHPREACAYLPKRSLVLLVNKNRGRNQDQYQDQPQQWD